MQFLAKRPLSTIAADIQRNWSKPFFGAVPYLEAMYHLTTIHDNYGHDDGKSIVLYFLSNAGSWRGEHARRLKDELKALL